MARSPVERVDLAIIGAGVAGTYIADAVQRARPSWSIAMYERSIRIGGRLRSVAIPGIDHRIELGGMRFLTSHRRVAAMVEAFDLPTHPFDATGGTERSFLRGRFGDGPSDATSGGGYDLAAEERARSALHLAREAFSRVIPGAESLDHDGYVAARSSGAFLGRPVTDWSIGDAIGAIRSSEGQRYVADAFGYDSGIRAFNAGDAIEFLLGGGDPTAEARTPDAGMNAIPRALAARFEAAGGSIRLRHELRAVDRGEGGRQLLQFADGLTIEAGRTVMAIAIPALRLVADESPPMRTPAFARVLDSVEGFQAMKLYLWYDLPWWRDSVSGIRMTTDLPVRKVFYLDTQPDKPAALLAMYTDGRDVQPWIDLARGAVSGGPAPERMLDEVQDQLHALHPSVLEIPRPAGSALMHWGADPCEIGWTFWRPGFRSDEILALAPQPEPLLGIYLAGESFSRSQSWVEGALESADQVVERLTAAPTRSTLSPRKEAR